MSDRILWINDLRGGRNDTDPPSLIRDNQVVEALNVDWKDATLARKRGGTTSVATTGGTAFGSAIGWLFRHVPGADETLAELWATDTAFLTKRLAGGTSWANVTFDDAISTSAGQISGVSLNGKLFIAYDGPNDRLHVYDPNLASARVRRVAFATPGPPTVANTAGGGAYAAVIGYWRVRWLQLSGTTVIRRSEPSSSTSFTPSGANTGVIITQPAVASEGETHWEVEFSPDNSVWTVVAGSMPVTGAGATAIATTTTTVTTAYATLETYSASDPAGMYGRWPSVKFLSTDGNRLLGAGAWEPTGTNSGGKNSRVWFSPVLGSADKGDDERVPNQTDQKNWVDLNENDGGGITGLSMPLNGTVYAFKHRQVWRLRPTGDVTTPYLPRKIRDDIGCISHRSIVVGEDHAGNAAIYFLSHRGPYRITATGDIQYLGRDNEATWRSITQIPTTGQGALSVFYPDLHQLWLWVSTSGSTMDTKFIFDVQRGFPDENGQIRGGWAKHTGAHTSVYAGCLFANTLGASMSTDLKPHAGLSTAATILKCDTSDLTDNGSNYQGYLTLKPLRAAPGMMMGLKSPTLLAKATANTNVSLTLVKDFGLETYPASTQSIAASASETRVFVGFDVDMSGAAVIQAQIGDASAAATTWTLDELMLPITEQEPQ